MSDGSVNTDNQIKLHINEKDKELFEYLKVISPNAGVYTMKGYESKAKVRGRAVKNKGSIALFLNSKTMCEDLAKYGIVQNKTYKQLSLPKISDELIRHFIRGYFDGDGCFTTCLRKPNPKHRMVNYGIRASFNICGKLDNIFVEMQKWFADKGIKTGIFYEKRDDMYRIHTQARQNLINLFHLLYDDSSCYLKRKFDKFNHYANTEVTQLITEHRNAQEVNVKESNNPPTSAEPLTDNAEGENIC